MYKSVLNAHLLPAMGSERLNEISKADVKQLVYGMFDRGLAHNSVIKNIACLSSILTSAIESEIITENPCRNIKIPKPESEKILFHVPLISIGLILILKKEAPKYHQVGTPRAQTDIYMVLEFMSNRPEIRRGRIAL